MPMQRAGRDWKVGSVVIFLKAGMHCCAQDIGFFPEPGHCVLALCRSADPLQLNSWVHVLRLAVFPGDPGHLHDPLVAHRVG